MDDFSREDLERVTAPAEAMLAHVEQLKGEIGSVVGRGEAADGQVRVTADASGRLTDVTLTPPALLLDGKRLAEAVLHAAQQAHDDAARQVDDVMTGTRDEPDQVRFTNLIESFEASMAERFAATEDQRRQDRRPPTR